MGEKEKEEKEKEKEEKREKEKEEEEEEITKAIEFDDDYEKTIGKTKLAKLKFLQACSKYWKDELMEVQCSDVKETKNGLTLTLVGPAPKDMAKAMIMIKSKGLS